MDMQMYSAHPCAHPVQFFPECPELSCEIFTQSLFLHALSFMSSEMTAHNIINPAPKRFKDANGWKEWLRQSRHHLKPVASPAANIASPAASPRMQLGPQVCIRV